MTPDATDTPEVETADAASVDATSVDATSVDATSVDATSADATSADATAPDATPAEALPAAALSGDALARALEAILMVADEPLPLVTLATALGAPMAAVREAVARFAAELDGHGEGPARGFELREVGGGWRLYVRPEFDGLVAQFVAGQSPSRLSQAALETLAVIAYKQPITRGAVASIRAVNVDSVVRTLVSRGLIQEAFTDPETGAIHYETTDLLLTSLGINSLDELPAISPLLPDGRDGFDDLS